MNSAFDISPYLFLTQEQAEGISAFFPHSSTLSSLSSFFKMFGDNTRLRILFCLIREELCVGDLAVLLNMTPSAVSHQLKLLKSAGLVNFRRSGKILYYSLADDHVRDIIKIGLEHVEE